MSARRTSRLLRLLIVPALLMTGLVAPVVTAAPAQASTAPTLYSLECDALPARFFQLRDGNANDGYSELWMASVTNPTSSNPTFYPWSKIQDFTGTVKPVSIAAKSIRRSTVSSGFVSWFYYSDSDDNLHLVKYASTETSKWTDRALTTSGLWGFKAMAWDGRLWGVKDANGDLYASTGLGLANDDPWAPPTGMNLVKSSFGFPRSFYGVTSGPASIGFAETSGALKYGIPGSTFTKMTVDSYYWNAGRTADVGGGLLFRFLGGSTNELRRYTIGDPDGLDTGITPKGDNADGRIESGVPSTDTPLTTVSSLCRQEQSVTDSTRAGMIARAKSWYDANVQYDQSASYGGYRTDCSGFVSMVWQLGTSATTRTLPDYSYNISWSDLQPGDAVLTPGHVVLFERWANTSKTNYWVYELGTTETDMNHRIVYGRTGQPIRKNGL